MIAAMACRIALEPANQPEVIALITDLDDFQKPLYPAESHHGIPIDALSQPNVLFAVARDASGAAAGCAAVVLNEGYGELKRMFVRTTHRGLGIGKALIAFLEEQASQNGCRLMMLETGVLQPEAIGLYQTVGYERRDAFGAYGPDPLSIFMQKTLPRHEDRAEAP